MQADTKYEDRLGTAPIIPLMVKMAVPSVLAQIVNLLYSIVDRIYIGHIPGEGTNALAGIGLTNSIIILVAAFAQFAGGGGAPQAAIALGQGDRKKAGLFLGNGLFLTIVLSLVCMAIVYAFMTPILKLIGASDVTMGYATDYLTVYMTGTFFVMAVTGLNTFITAQGRPGIAMCAVVVGAGLNIALDPLFIYAFGMGVKGAAIATVISQFVSACIVLGFLFSGKASLKIELANVRPDGKIILQIAKLGVAPFVMASTESLIGFALNGRLSIYGDIYVSALTVMQSAMTIVGVPLQGFTQGVLPLISYNYGRRDVVRFKKIIKYLFVFLVGANALINISVILFSGVVARIFTSDEVLIQTVTQMMPTFMFGMTIFGLQRACQNTFIATKQAGISLFIAVLRKLILLIPLVFILSHFIGVRGVYLAEGVADFAAAAICTVIFLFRFPKIVAGMSEDKNKPSVRI